MKRITMTATRQGCTDGHTVRTYEKDETYEVSDDLGNDFLAAKYARPAQISELPADERSDGDQGSDADATTDAADAQGDGDTSSADASESTETAPKKRKKAA